MTRFSCVTVDWQTTLIIPALSRTNKRRTDKCRVPASFRMPACQKRGPPGESPDLRKYPAHHSCGNLPVEKYCIGAAARLAVGDSKPNGRRGVRQVVALVLNTDPKAQQVRWTGKQELTVRICVDLRASEMAVPTLQAGGGTCRCRPEFDLMFAANSWVAGKQA